MIDRYEEAQWCDRSSVTVHVHPPPPPPARSMAPLSPKDLSLRGVVTKLAVLILTATAAALTEWLSR